MPSTHLQKLFAPSSVAVIGASTRPDSLGRAVFSNILLSGFTGVAYPVHPKAHSILGVRAYPSVTEIPDQIDLAVIIVPADAAIGVLEECGRKEIPAAILLSAGFKEIGGIGIEREKRVQQIAGNLGIALIGPNCLGLINTDRSVLLNATFARGSLKPGRLAFISQSGAVGVAALEYAQTENIGLSKFISIGNKAIIHENHLLAALADDPHTDVILLYLEDLEDPREFTELARQISEKKPILAIKSGRTREGAAAAASHTGALAGSDEAYDSIFEQSGVLRVESLQELFDCAITLAHQPLPRSDKIAIVTNSGGPGIIATDAAVRHGLQIATLGPKTQEQLRAQLPPTASLRNPVDLIGDADAERYRAALTTVLADENVGSVIAICTPQMTADLEAIARAIAEPAEIAKKPMLTCLMALGEAGPALNVFDAHRIPCYRFPEAAARALSAMARYSHWRQRRRTEIKYFADTDRARAETIIRQARAAGRKFLPEPEAYEVLQAYGFPLAKSRFARDENEALRAAGEIGYPIVLKVVSPQIVHKFDLGGVQINLRDEAHLRSAYREMLASIRLAKPDAQFWGVMIQEYLRGGHETILGMKRDPHFGPLLLFGLGGIYVEVFQDVTFRVAPIRELSAYRMIEGIRGYKILTGFRGQPPADTDAIAECIQRLSQMALELESISELDINPLIVLEKGRGARVVDARILL
ncbi:acetate--CoA ligase family protein [Candidatus Acetothermia bacterium]|jgi:acetyltransferase|nr:acetate--CoA ligase family protein [Candidatus Acetothermia bacterium]MCI2432234.1 acetate--CoA ligase family protein [Candidatus Acetothermia bacterium]MCI2436490.1 acetate--CoA ligase family protein [Candidatus Acetothermia bacterium]